MLTNCIQLQSMHVVYSGKRLIGYGPYGIVSLSRTFFWFYLILKFFLPNPLCSFRSLAVFFLAVWRELGCNKGFKMVWCLVYNWFGFSFSCFDVRPSHLFKFIIMWYLCSSSSNSNLFDCCNQDALLQKLLNDNYLSEEERSVEYFLFIYPLLSTDMNS